jgi:hypothetical protein
MDPLGTLVDAESAEALQGLLAAFDGSLQPVAAYLKYGPADRIHPGNFHWHVREQLEPKRFLGILSKAYNDDLFAARDPRWGRGPRYLNWARWYDVSTAAISIDDPRLPLLPEPWRTTRLWLYPMIAGLFLAHDPRH